MASEVETYGKLVFLSKDGSEIEFPLDKTSILIGRDPSCDIRMVNREISRKHAEIYMDKEGRVLVDSKGREPINVNGKAVTSPQELVTGDKIEVLLEGRSRVFYYYATGEDTVILPQRPPLARKNADMCVNNGVASPPAPAPLLDRHQDVPLPSAPTGLLSPRPPSKRRSIESAVVHSAPDQVTGDVVDAKTDAKVPEAPADTCQAPSEMEAIMDCLPEAGPVPPTAPADPLEAIVEEKTEDLRAAIESEQNKTVPQEPSKSQPCATPEGAPQPVDFSVSGFSKKDKVHQAHSNGIEVADSTIAFAEWAMGDGNGNGNGNGVHPNANEEMHEEMHEAMHEAMHEEMHEAQEHSQQQLHSVVNTERLSGGLRAPAPTPVTGKKTDNENNTMHKEIFMNDLGDDFVDKLASLAEEHDVEFRIMASPPRSVPPEAFTGEQQRVPNTQNSSRRAIVTVTPKSASGISHSIRQVSLVKKTPWDENIGGGSTPLDQSDDAIVTSNLKSARRLASALEGGLGSARPRESFQGGKEKTPAGTKIALLLCSAAKSQHGGAQQAGASTSIRPTPKTAQASCRVVFDAADRGFPKEGENKLNENEMDVDKVVVEEEGGKQTTSVKDRVVVPLFPSPRDKVNRRITRNNERARAYRAHAAALARRLQGTMARALRLKRVVRALAGSLKRERQRRKELQAQYHETIRVAGEAKSVHEPTEIQQDAPLPQRVVVVRPPQPGRDMGCQPVCRVVRAGCVVVVRPSICRPPAASFPQQELSLSGIVMTPHALTPGTSGVAVQSAVPNTVVVVPATVCVQSGRHTVPTSQDKKQDDTKKKEEEDEDEDVRRALMVADDADVEEEVEASELQSLERQVMDLVSQEAKRDFDDAKLEQHNIEAEKEEEGEDDETVCHVCNSGEEGDVLLLCDGCDVACHLTCATPPLKRIPKGDWYCHECAAKRAQLEEKNTSKAKAPRGKTGEASKSGSKRQKVKDESSKDATKPQNSKKSKNRKDLANPRKVEPEVAVAPRPTRRQRR